jgi:glycine cleavage system regulatory protein
VIYLLTVRGKDNIGLVEALAGHIEQRGGNWLESRLCRLGGQFAGIVRVEFSTPPLHLPEKVQSLFCHWETVSEDDSVQSGTQSSARIDILAADRPGLVKQITHLLSLAGANVEEIESRVRSAPFSGEQMFEAHCLISLGSKVDRGKLVVQLESLAEELMCDISYEDELETLVH